ncbi:MAG: FapA family protein [Eubacteriales bacterium]
MKKESGFFGAMFKKKAVSQVEETAQVAPLATHTGTIQPESVSQEVIEEVEVLPPPLDTLIDCNDGGLYRLWETGYAGSGYKPDLIFECGATPLPMEQMRQNLEMKRLKSWVDNVGNAHMKLVSEELKKHNEQVNAEKEMATAEGRSPKPVPMPPLDAVAAFSLSGDGMVGWLIILPPMGEGALVEAADVQMFIDENKIVYGINQDYIDSMVKNKRYFHLFPVVMGTAPVRGDDGRITEFYSRERICAFTPDADGNLDYRAQNYFQPVFQDGTICEIHLPTEGIEGTNARGEPVEAKPGEPAKIQVGSNTHITEEGTELVADIDGDVVFEKDTFVVRSAMQVAGDVDYSTGNINFMGDVHIKGNVRDKFIVRATGSVVVDGLLESAIIDADGDVIIAGGVLGDNEGTIRSRGNVRAKFMESCIVYSAQSIQTDYILGSEVFCDGPLMVNTGKGVIIGGNVSVHSYIEVKAIGSPHTGRATTLNMGVPPCGGGENFVDAQGVDPAAMLLEVAAQGDSVEQMVNCRGKFQNIHVGVVINFARDTLNIEREWNGVNVRYDEKEQRILLT